MICLSRWYEWLWRWSFIVRHEWQLVGMLRQMLLLGLWSRCSWYVCIERLQWFHGTSSHDGTTVASCTYAIAAGSLRTNRPWRWTPEIRLMWMLWHLRCSHLKLISDSVVTIQIIILDFTRYIPAAVVAASVDSSSAVCSQRATSVVLH